MRLSVSASILLVLAAGVRAQPTAGVQAQPAADTEPKRLAIEERVPRAWVLNDPDSWPLEPARWRRRMPRRCRTQGGYRRFCQGERRVATPTAEERARAERLSLGHRLTARWLMHHPAFDEWLEAVAHTDAERRLTFPVPNGRLGRGFGRVRRGSVRHRRHNGVDIGAPEGSPIVAARGGLVAYADDGITGFGNALLVLHADGFTTFYAHCQALRVAPGAFVARGQHVADVGTTGFAWAPHLHFEWRQQGWARDPGPRFLE
ncbi:MAG: M23 family metallopeptidase [Myxococcota bacterium]